MNIIKPEVTHGIVNRVTGSVFSYQGWPTITKDEKGTIYAVVSGFRVSHICPFGKTVMYISHDEGNTWTPPIVINDTYMDDRDAGIVYMGEGKLLVSWFTHSAERYTGHYSEKIKNYADPAARAAVLGLMEGYKYLPEEEKRAGSYVRMSNDYGVTWGETVFVPVSAPHGPALCKDGSLIYVGTEIYTEDRVKASERPNIPVAVYKSTDGGYTWNRLASITKPEWMNENEWLDEPHAIELPDGRILAAFRIEGRDPFSIGTAISTDGGLSWSDVRCTDVSGSPPHFMLHSSGALICSHGRREKPYGERAMVSYDFGETWTDAYILDERSNSDDIGYPTTVELSDGSLFTAYYQRYENDEKCSVLYTRWRLNK